MYDTGAYASYIASGFDYLYDKVGMYDCIRGIICGQRPAASITYQWQQTDRVNQHMLYFLENHDEQRIASDFFAGDPEKAIPGAVVSILMRNNPFMLYNGQEYGDLRLLVARDLALCLSWYLEDDAAGQKFGRYLS